MAGRKSFLSGRYTVELEWNGTSDEPRYVARFEGEKIGEADTELEARRIAFRHHNRRTSR